MASYHKKLGFCATRASPAFAQRPFRLSSMRNRAICIGVIRVRGTDKQPSVERNSAPDKPFAITYSTYRARPRQKRQIGPNARSELTRRTLVTK